MVSNSALAALCVKCGIHQLVDTRAHGISHNVKAYVSAVTTALHEERRASSQEGRHPAQYWLRFQSPEVSQPTRLELEGCPNGNLLGPFRHHGGYPGGFIRLR